MEKFFGARCRRDHRYHRYRAASSGSESATENLFCPAFKSVHAETPERAASEQRAKHFGLGASPSADVVF